MRKRILSVMITLCMSMTLIPEGAVKISAAETVHSGKSGNLEWTIDSDGLLTVTGEGNYDVRYFQEHSPEWCDYGDEIKSAKVKVSGITSTSSMFKDCDRLTSVDFSDFATESVTDMSSMFYGCNSLTSLDLSGLSTENVTEMSSMFYECSSLGELNLSGLSTGNVTDMAFMFAGCNGMTSINLSNFATAKVEYMDAMFQNCSNLKSLDLGDFNTGNVMFMGSMFSGCSKLISVNLSSFDTRNVVNMGYMFENCSSLRTLDLGSFQGVSVMNMERMFYGCGSLTQIHTPINLVEECDLPVGIWKDSQGTIHLGLPRNEAQSIVLTKGQTFIDPTEPTTNGVAGRETTTVKNQLGTTSNVSATTKNQGTVSASQRAQNTEKVKHPAKVSKVKAQNLKGKKVKLTWKKMSGVSGYQITYATNKKFKKNKKGN